MAMERVVRVALGSAAFVIFWVLAVFPAVPFLQIRRTTGSLLGAMLMVLLGVMSADEVTGMGDPDGRAGGGGGAGMGDHGGIARHRSVWSLQAPAVCAAPRTHFAVFGGVSGPSGSSDRACGVARTTCTPTKDQRHWKSLTKARWMMSMFLLQLLKGRYLQVEEAVTCMGFLVGMEQLRERLAQRVFMVHFARNGHWEHTRTSLGLLSLCFPCPPEELPRRAIYISVRGAAETPCPYICVSDRYRMPHCYTALEELIYTFGGPWLFGLFLSGLLILLVLVLSVAHMKFVGTDELPGPAPTQQGSQIDHSFPFLESLNEVLESHGHVHRMYFMGPNTFSEPWHLPHTPPEGITEIVYEDAFNQFVDEMNTLAAYQWWEGSIYSILCILAYPVAWSWQQWHRRKKLQRLCEFVRSEYDHSCLRSCRSRAQYEGLKV